MQSTTEIVHPVIPSSADEPHEPVASEAAFLLRHLLQKSASCRNLEITSMPQATVVNSTKGKHNILIFNIQTRLRHTINLIDQSDGRNVWQSLGAWM